MITEEKRAELETRLLNLWRNGRLFKENPSLVEAFACQAVSLFKPEFDRIAELEATVAELRTQLSDAQALAHKLSLESFAAAPKEEKEAFLKALHESGLGPAKTHTEETK